MKTNPVKRPRRKRFSISKDGSVIPYESVEQKYLIQWAKWMNIPIFHIPNGGRRDKKEAAKLKREGVESGIPDNFIPVPVDKYHGMFLELKRIKDGKPSIKQLYWLKKLEELGYCTRIAYGWIDGAQKISEYLKIPFSSSEDIFLRKAFNESNR